MKCVTRIKNKRTALATVTRELRSFNSVARQPRRTAIWRMFCALFKSAGGRIWTTFPVKLIIDLLQPRDLPLATGLATLREKRSIPFLLHCDLGRLVIRHVLFTKKYKYLFLRDMRDKDEIALC